MFKKWFNWAVVENPVEAIVTVCAFCLVAYGFYYGLPVSLNDVHAAVSAMFNTQAEHIFVAIGLCSPGLYAIYGAIRRDSAIIHSSSLFMIMAWLFLVAIRIMVFGWLPLAWLLFLIPVLVLMISALHLGAKKK
jgi:hypothetical protein